jgi:uncharacterized membrane protein HdeD (DUF308 family)
MYIVFVWYNRQLLDMAGLTRINLLLTAVRIIITLAVLFLSAPAVSGIHMAIAFGAGWFVEGVLCLSFIHQKRLLI